MSGFPLLITVFFYTCVQFLIFLSKLPDRFSALLLQLALAALAAATSRFDGFARSPPDDGDLNAFKTFSASSAERAAAAAEENSS